MTRHVSLNLKGDYLFITFYLFNVNGTFAKLRQKETVIIKFKISEKARHRCDCSVLIASNGLKFGTHDYVGISYISIIYS